MSFNVTARYFDGKTSAAQNVTVIIDDRDVLIADPDGEICKIARQDLLLCEKPETNRPLRLRRAQDNGMRIVFDAQDASSVADALRHGSPAVAVDEASRKSMTRLISGIVGFTVLVGLTIWLGVPVAVNIVADHYPRQSEIALGKAGREQILFALEQLEDDFAVCTPKNAAHRAVQQIVAQLSSSKPFEYDYDVTFVRSKIPNALALPGGQVLVFSGLLDIMESPEAFTGVLAHEIGHSEKHHGLRNMFSNIAVTQLIRLISGGSAMVPAEFILQQGYTRDMEREADQFALETMERANIRMTDTAVLFGKLNKTLKDDAHGLDLPEMFSSHPDMEARIAQFENAPSTGAVDINGQEWQALKSACDE